MQSTQLKMNDVWMLKGKDKEGRKEERKEGRKRIKITGEEPKV